MMTFYGFINLTGHKKSSPRSNSEISDGPESFNADVQFSTDLAERENTSGEKLLRRGIFYLSS